MSISALGFLILFFGLLGLAIVRHPVYGLYAYAASFFLHPPSRWWGASLPDIRWAYWSAVITLALTVLHLTFRSGARHKDWYRQGCIWLLFLYMLWMWVQSSWAVSPYQHERALGLFQNYLIVLFLVYVLIDTRERLVQFMFVAAMGCFYLGYVAYTATGGSGRLDGVGGPGIDDASSLGMVLGVGAAIAGTLFISQKGIVKWLSLASLPFLLNGIILAGSRGAFLAIACGGLAIFYCRPRGNTGRLVLIAFLGCAAFANLANDFFWDRMSTITAPVSKTKEADLSTETRMVLIGKQWEMFLDRPYGGGAKTTQKLSPLYLESRYRNEAAGRASHNTVMSALVDQGVIGIVLWFALAFGVIRKALRLRKLTWSRHDAEAGWINGGLFAALTIYFVAGQFAPFLQQEIYIWLVGLMWAATAIFEREMAESEARSTEAAAAPQSKGRGGAPGLATSRVR